jgi:hypothetical protein
MTARYYGPAPAPASPGENRTEGWREGWLSRGEAGDRNPQEPRSKPRFLHWKTSEENGASCGVFIIPRNREKTPLKNAANISHGLERPLLFMTSLPHLCIYQTALSKRSPGHHRCITDPSPKKAVHGRLFSRERFDWSCFAYSSAGCSLRRVRLVPWTARCNFSRVCCISTGTVCCSSRGKSHPVICW